MESTLITVRRRRNGEKLFRHPPFHRLQPFIIASHIHCLVYSVYESRKNSSEKRTFYISNACCAKDVPVAFNKLDRYSLFNGSLLWLRVREAHMCFVSASFFHSFKTCTFQRREKIVLAVEKKTKHNMKMRSVRSLGCIWGLGKGILLGFFRNFP